MGAGYVDGDLEAVRADARRSPHRHGPRRCGCAREADLRWLDADHPDHPLGARPARAATQIPLELLVEKQTRRNARLYGLADRGTVEVGMRADLNVIDLDNLTVRRAEAVEDLPAGGWRFNQPVSGYLATLVAGVQTRSHDADTGERPGRLLRRGR